DAGAAGEILAVDGVHVGVVLHVAEGDVAGDDVVEGQARGVEDRDGGPRHLGDLGGEIRRERPIGENQGGEARQVQRVPGPDGGAAGDAAADRLGLEPGRPDDLARGQVRRGDAGDLDVRAAGDPVDDHRGAGGLASVLEELVVDPVGDLEVFG